MRIKPSDKKIRTGACLRILTGTALAVFTAACLTGCGDGTGETPKAAAETSSDTAAPAESTPKPTKAPSYIKKLVYTSADKTVSLRLDPT